MWLYFLGFLAFLILYRWYRQRQILGNLTDKYVFITGCDTGFGNLLARQLDKRGMCVLAACLTQSGAEHLKNSTSERLETVILDVTDSQSVINAGLWVKEIVGEKGLWGLVNNAGISGLVAPNGWLKKEDYLKPLNVNLMGTIEVTLTLLPLIRRARGRIVNVSSTLGRVALLAGGYTISKYGVEAFSDTLRRELVEFGIKVSIIEPGGFVTGITDMTEYSRELKDTWRSQTRETKKCYGKDYTEKYLNYMIRAFVASSTKTYLVTDCMEHALIARYPWTRYSAGWDAKLILIPLSYMPTFLVDFQARRRLPKAVQDDDEDD